MNIARRLRHTASIPTALAALGLVLGSGAIAHAQQIPQPPRAVVQPLAIPSLHLPTVRSLDLLAGTRTSSAERAPTLNVNCNTGGNLQNRIDAASGGATILVKGTCVGNFTVQRSLTLDANRSATLDGNDAGTTLTIDAPGRTVRLLGMTVTGGQSTTGAGILKVDGSLVLDRARIKGNLATNVGTAVGGGIYSLGGPAITVRNSTISNNRVEGTSGTAVGGAIVSMDRNLSISNSTLSDNVVVMNGNGTAAAGALYLTEAGLTVKGSTFAGNEIAANGTTGAQAIGSVLYQTAITDRPTMIVNTLMTRNTAEANTTNGSATGVGPLGSNVETVELIHSRVVNSLTEVSSVNGSATVLGIYRPTGLTRLVDSLVADNEIVSLGGTTAVAQGAGMVASRAMVTDSSISGNEASTDSAAGDSTSVAGGLFAAKLTMARSRVIGNGTHAEATGGDAQAYGGGVYAPDGKLTASTIAGNDVTALATGIRTATGVGGAIYGAGMPITNSTIANNVVRAFAPNAAGTAQSYGGGVTMAAAAVKASTIAGNRVLATSPGDEDTVGGGLYASSGVRVSSSILANNEALLGPDCSGGPESKGFVLLRTPSGCALDSKPTDVKYRNPKLGRLRNNGGPTPTMAIAGGSPALNRIPTGPCSVKVDQRGVKRPQGPRCDIGAYERKVG